MWHKNYDNSIRNITFQCNVKSKKTEDTIYATVSNHLADKIPKRKQFLQVS